MPGTINRFLHVICLALACALAQMPGAALAEEPPEISQARPPLWLVERGHARIWLLGSVNALPEVVDWLNGPVAKAIEQADEVMLEVWPPEPGRINELVKAQGIMPEGQSLADEVEPAVLAEFHQILGKHGYKPAMLDQFRAWYAAVALGALCSSGHGLRGDLGVHARVQAIADQRRFKTAGLETGGEQIDRLISLSDHDQRALLSQIMQDCKQQPSPIQAMIAAWASGDVEKLEAANPYVYASPIVAYRNPLWADWIEARLQGARGEILVVTSMGNLIGPESVQVLLERRGVRVSRVQ